MKFGQPVLNHYLPFYMIWQFRFKGLLVYTGFSLKLASLALMVSECPSPPSLSLPPLQDEEENERPVTPQQIPPSTASIPPSLPVIPSGGVGHTISTHLPLPAVQAQVQSQLLTQLPPRPSPILQLAQSPQVTLAALQAMSLSSAGVGSTVAARLPGLPNPYQTFQGVLPRQVLTTSLPPTVTPPGLSYSTIMGGALQQQQQATTLLLQQQQQQLQLLQQQALIQRGLATLPVRTGGSEMTPPPAKRHAMELPYQPGLPQHMNQISTGAVGFPPPLANYPQQLNSQPGPFGSPGLPPPPPPVASSSQPRPIMPTAVTGYIAMPAGSMPWQQQK